MNVDWEQMLKCICTKFWVFGRYSALPVVASFQMLRLCLKVVSHTWFFSGKIWRLAYKKCDEFWQTKYHCILGLFLQQIFPEFKPNSITVAVMISRQTVVIIHPLLSHSYFTFCFFQLTGVFGGWMVGVLKP